MSTYLGTFYGHTTEYWLELQSRADATPGFSRDLLEEVCILRGKVSFYEARIEQMSAVMVRK